MAEKLTILPQLCAITATPFWLQYTTKYKSESGEDRAENNACKIFGQTYLKASRDLHLSLELGDVTQAFKDGKQFHAHEMIMAATSPMAHTNFRELCQLFEKWTSSL